MKVKRYLVNTGNGTNSTQISIVDDNWIPISPYISNYLRSCSSGQPNTRAKHAEDLHFLLTFLNAQNKGIGIDIISRAESGDFLDRKEVNKFVEAANKRKSSIGKTTQKKNFTNKSLQNAIHSSQVGKERVSAGTTLARLRVAIKFITFLFEEIHGKYYASKETSANFNQVIDILCEEKENIKSFNNTVQESESKIPPTKYLQLLEVIQPDSPNNPFKHSKTRNCLIVQLMLATGIRRGAIAKLKISDCKFHGTGDTIYVTRTPDDPSDKRRIKPAQKTKSHPSYVDPEMMDKLNHYIEYQRSRFPASQTHEFVFVAEMDSRGTKGMPLSLNQINYMFDKISDVINFKIHPHLTRYKFNEIFSEETAGMSGEAVSKLRKHINGWSKTSDMDEIYNQFKLSIEAKEAMKKRQSEIMNAGRRNAR